MKEMKKTCRKLPVVITIFAFKNGGICTQLKQLRLWHSLGFLIFFCTQIAVLLPTFFVFTSINLGRRGRKYGKRESRKDSTDNSVLVMKQFTQLVTRAHFTQTPFRTNTISHENAASSVEK